jgi:tRNA nucleotidyltransferase (CCA-adding enzyme)
MQEPGRQHWEHFSHQADIGVRGCGTSVAEAFEQAAVALTAVVAEPGRVRAERAVSIRCEAPDLELLLVEWLNALVYEMAVRRMLFSDFQVRIDGCRLSAQARGETVDRDRHQPAVEVKGATCTALSVARDQAGNWCAQCIVDV